MRLMLCMVIMYNDEANIKCLILTHRGDEFNNFQYAKWGVWGLRLRG